MESIHIPEDSDCEVFGLSSLNMNNATPVTMSSTKRYFFSAYDFRPTNTPRIMTGTGLADFAIT